MPKVEFTRDTDPSKEGGIGFKKGHVEEMSTASMRHWLARNAVRVLVEDSAPPLRPAQRAQVVSEMDKQISEIANAQSAPPPATTAPAGSPAAAGTVDSTAGVGGSVGHGAVADASASGRGKGGGRSGNSGQ